MNILGFISQKGKKLTSEEWEILFLGPFFFFFSVVLVVFLLNL